MTSPGRDAHQRRDIRLAATVIVAAMVLWLGGSALGGALGLPVRFVFLLDLAAMAALIWAMIVLFRIWRARRDNGA